MCVLFVGVISGRHGVHLMYEVKKTIRNIVVYRISKCQNPSMSKVFKELQQ